MRKAFEAEFREALAVGECITSHAEAGFFVHDPPAPSKEVASLAAATKKPLACGNIAGWGHLACSGLVTLELDWGQNIYFLATYHTARFIGDNSSFARDG